MVCMFVCMYVKSSNEFSHVLYDMTRYEHDAFLDDNKLIETN